MSYSYLVLRRKGRPWNKSNSLVDERRDPIKATWAAARYLKDMYDIYKDWNLVIAAYNCGPGTICLLYTSCVHCGFVLQSIARCYP